MSHLASSHSPNPDGSGVRNDKYVDMSDPTIYHSLAQLYLTKKYSDLTIKCGCREFKAHKAVICSQSSFFDKESATGTVWLEEDDPEVLARFLEYLYTGNYKDGEYVKSARPAASALLSPEDIKARLDGQHPVGTSLAAGDTESEDAASYAPDEEAEYESWDEEYEEGGEEEDGEEEGEEEEADEIKDGESTETLTEAPTHQAQGDHDLNLYNQRSLLSLRLSARVYLMADKFDVPALQLLARDRFLRTAEAFWTKVDEFPALVDEIFTKTPDTDTNLRQIICRLVAVQYHDQDVQARMQPVMMKHPSFAMGVMHCMMRYWRDGQEG